MLVPCCSGLPSVVVLVAVALVAVELVAVELVAGPLLEPSGRSRVGCLAMDEVLLAWTLSGVARAILVVGSLVLVEVDPLDVVAECLVVVEEGW